MKKTILPWIFVFAILIFCFVFFGHKTNLADAQAASCTNWALVKNLGGNVLYDPSIAAASDRLIVTGVGTNKALFANEYVISTGASGWYTLDGTLYSGTKMTMSNGVVAAAVVGGDNAVFSRQYQSPGIWTAWHNDGQVALGNTGPTQTTLGSILYRVIRTTSNAAEIDKCADVCSAGAISGCKVCNIAGTAWVDDSSKCASTQICKAGQCTAIPYTIPSLWFVPLPSGMGGCTDYLDLFNKDTQWQDARKKISVFKLYGPFYNWLSASDTSTIVAKLNQWSIDIGLEEGAVKPWGCTGDATAPVTITDIKQIGTANGKVKYISMDEPFGGGQYAQCNQTMDQSLGETAKYANLIKQSYPDIIVGDIEPYPHFSENQLEQWITGFKSKAGYDFPFFQVDINYPRAKLDNDNAAGDLSKLSAFCKARNIKFAVIAGGATWYNYPTPIAADKDFYDSTLADAKWTLAQVPQDFSIMQSWGAYPKKCLPDSSGYSFTQLTRDFAVAYGVPDAPRNANICSPGAVSGCQVCNAQGTAWVDTESKCVTDQQCINGQCEIKCANWSIVKNLGGVVKYDPSVAALGNRLVITGVGTNNAGFGVEYASDGTIVPWYSLGGTLTTATEMTASTSGISMKATGTDGNVWEKIFTATKTWSGWANTGSKVLGSVGPVTASMNGVSYKVIKKSDGSTELDSCNNEQICTPLAVNGCKVCNAQGTVWFDADYKCAVGQVCSDGVCVAKVSDCGNGVWDKGETLANCPQDCTQYCAAPPDDVAILPTGNYIVGTYVFPGHHHLYSWDNVGPNVTLRDAWAAMINATPLLPGADQPKVPLINGYDDTNQTVTDQMIKMGLEHGVSLFVYDWYWLNGQSMSTLQEPLENTFLKSKYFTKYPDKLKFALYYPADPDNNEDPVKMMDYIIKNYFKYSQYLRIDGKPVFYVGNFDQLGGIFSTAAHPMTTASVLSQWKQMAKTAGYNGIVFMSTDDTLSGRIANRCADTSVGMDGDTFYAWVTPGQVLSSGPFSGLKYDTYEQFMTAHENEWTTMYNCPGNYVFPVISPGWDVTDKAAANLRSMYTGSSPEKYKLMAQAAKTFIGQNNLQPKIIMNEAWDEWSEGSVLAPTKKWGFGYLDAIKDVFGTTCMPAEVSGCKVCNADGSVWSDDGSKCANGQICSNGTCVLNCIPICVGKSCGSDGCQGSCGACTSNQTCSDGTCQSNGGGGGGGTTPPVINKPVNQMTRAEILAAIAKIQALIADLQKQLAALTGSNTSTFSCTQLTKNLFYGMQNDPQVKCLQEVLKSQGYGVAPTGNYGAVTKAAVAQFQQKYASEILAPYHLARGSGNVGNATKAKLNSLISGK